MGTKAASIALAATVLAGFAAFGPTVVEARLSTADAKERVEAAAGRRATRLINQARAIQAEPGPAEQCRRQTRSRVLCLANVHGQDYAVTWFDCYFLVTVAGSRMSVGGEMLCFGFDGQRRDTPPRSTQPSSNHAGGPADLPALLPAPAAGTS